MAAMAPAARGRPSARLPLLSLVAASLAVALLLSFAPAASARGWGSLDAKYTCNPASNYGMWFKYGCNCQNISIPENGYRRLWATCPGVNPTAYGRRAFGNVWLESVGYQSWVSALMNCARRPFYGNSFNGQCLIPGIYTKPYWVGGGPTPPNRANGQPWNWNPEPPYL
ncbi:hypothetical protein CLOM_g40004 [Closterium sp. NIES-68]|uniref:19-kDa subunit of protoplast-release-inducing protein n=2 Tax=Closterium peracerosum-strigosum-littorale complex TaxID=34146 RepID=Q7GDV8_9VIRI|nr:putative 19 kDa subunit of protoplast-release-inducing protein [Closterium sp. NIES-67]BAA25381.1 19-kDa subunit of protoplast-release-inducing protein [Closterium peracerosum-strigosum-littorale complex]GJP37233.1 hypothetical protein CLOM_g40004 [Closterium sp. NIES-68]GJP70461.1 hypothetical protein CLOP_g40004 [Closterium sp. NIES-67]